MRHGTLLSLILLCLLSSAVLAQDDSITFDNLARVSYDDQYVATVSADNLGMRNATIWVATPDGSERLAVARSGEDFWVTNPLWSPHANELAYLKVRDVALDEFSVVPAFELWTVKADGSGARLLTDAPALNPALSYGGEADLEWTEQGEILFSDNAAWPIVRYALHVQSGEIRKVGESTGGLGEAAVGGQPSNVPYFNQCDSRWKNNRLGTCSSTICRAGCAMSSVAMILKYYGASVDPARLNSWLTSRGGYASGCLIYWGAAANYHSGTTYSAHVGWQDWNRLRAELNAGYPVIVNVKSGGHWVVVTHYSGGTYYINDPGYSSRKTLASYGNRFSRMIIYHGKRPSPTPTPVTPTPKITKVSPNPMRPLALPQRQPITISGSGFVKGAKLLFKILDPPSSYPNRVPSSLSSTKIVYNISVGPKTHNWTVQVINPDGKASNVYPFRVEPASSDPTPDPTGSGVVKVYRMWKQSWNDHLYTTNRNEGLSSGYVDEGDIGYVYSAKLSGTVPVYRRWHSGKLDHFYTTSSTEGLSIGYVNQGILGYVYPTQRDGTWPVYRQFHFRKNDHFYTQHVSERDMARDVIGYVDEGILGYFLKKSSATLTVKKSGSGSGTVTAGGISCGSDCTESYKTGATVTLQATPASGMVFAGWQGACSGSGSCSVTMTSATSVTAVFNQKARSVNASAAEGGTIAPSGIVSVPYGTSKRFSITPKTGHKVSKLIVDGTALPAAMSYEFSHVSADHSIRAYFERVTHTIRAGAGSGGSISPDGESVVAHDGSQAYTIQADEGYEIADVKVDGVSIGAKTSYTFEHVIADHRIDATFKVLATVGLLLDESEGKAGSAGHAVQIALNNPTDAVSSLQFRVNYDATSGLHALGGATGYRVTDRSQGFSVSLSVTENGADSDVLVLLYDFSGKSIDAGTGSILELLFSIDAEATPGDMSALSFNEGIAADAAAQPMGVSFSDTGSVTILDACDKGDVNCDGRVDVLDVQSLLNCISGSGSCERCDLNEDGQQNVIDVQVLVNIINNVPSQSGPGSLKGDLALAGSMILDLPELELQAGANGRFGLLLENDEAVSAGQFAFSYDSTKGFDVTGVNLTERSAGFYEPILFVKDASDPQKVEVFVLFFSLDGSVIEPGHGAILDFTYTTDPQASGTLQPVLEELLLVDEQGEVLTAPPGGTPDTPPTEPQDSYLLSVTRSGSGSGQVLSQPAGIDCGGECSEEYAAGTDITLTALPDEGSVFVGWFGSCGGSEDCAVTMDANHSVEAIFDLLETEYTIQAEAGEGGVIDPAGSVTVARGASQLFSAIPQEGYEVKELRVDGVSQGALDSYHFEDVLADHTIEVSFIRSDMQYSSIVNFNDDGHSWEDVDKSEDDPEDDWLCWAAAAANILAWTGWGTEIYDTAEEIFSNFQEHWSNGGGLMEYAWNWWFDGSIPDTQAGWATLNEGSASSDSGGAYHAEVDFVDYFYEDWAYYDEETALWNDGSGLMETVDQYVTQGFGTSLAVYNGLGGHALSVWGYEFDETGGYSGVWVSDSDDGQSDLKLLSVSLDLDNNLWYLDLENRYNYSGWFIGAVQTLEQNPTDPVPEPGTFLLLGLGLLLGIAVKRKRTN